jgi:hypothetical protein
MSSLKEWLMKEDEILYLLQRSLWNSDPEDLEDELFQLGPHALNYTSELKPVFLFEIENYNQLKLFDSVMVRDGAISLLSFFWHWPSPPDGHAKLLIHERLSYLVPSAWEKLVSYYSFEVDEQVDTSFQEVVFTGFIHPSIICLENLESLLNNMNKQCELKEKDAYVMTEVFSPRDDDRYQRTNPYYVDLIGLLKSFFPKLKGISWNELSTRDVQRMKFLNLDEYKMMCADSYVYFHLLSKGGRPFFGHKRISESFGTLELSPFHRLHLSQGKGPQAQLLGEKLYSELEALKDEISQDFVSTQALRDRSHLTLGSPPELSSFLFTFLKNNENAI